ncbi:MAG: hypothetical protein ABI467_08715 [Kofleriaceae bacterium]
MTDVSKSTRFIAVAQPSDTTNAEWKDFYARRGQAWTPPPETHKDYALLKVLHMLRKQSVGKKIHVHTFKYDASPTGLDFSDLAPTDAIFIVGHGNGEGLYTMGPNAKAGAERFIDLLTMDGTLAAKRKQKKIDMLLLSCRAGLGLHKGVARKLFDKLSLETNVGGAIGFTFGSLRTGMFGMNEVLIRGIPWWMEYPTSISPAEAEQATTAHEGTPITIADKKTQIDQFIADAADLTTRMKNVVATLTSTEVNAALDELADKHAKTWWPLIEAQFLLYSSAKKQAGLGFDMWYDKVHDAYVWANSRKVTDAQANAVFVGDLEPTDDGVVSTR